MIIYKKETGEAFDLPGEFNLEVEYNNPIFSDNGSQSIPITLPMTKKNRRMLGYPDVMESSKNPEFKTEVIVDTEGMQKIGTMVLLDSKGSVSIGFDDGDAYSRIKKLKLKNLKGLPFYQGTSIAVSNDREYNDNNLNELINKFNTIINSESQEDNDYRIFPVLVKRSEIDNEILYKGINKLNRVQNQWKLKGSYAFTESTDMNGSKNEMSCAKGYSIAPFLLLHRVIEFAMTEIGYTIKENIFRTDKSLSRLCVLHNCMDPICKGYLDYKDLMPNCTISELIDTLKARFGAIFYFDSNEKSVTIRLIKDTINKTSKIDITSYVKSIETSFEKPKYLKLICRRDFESAQTESESMEEFARKHFNMCNHRKEGFVFKKINNLNLRLRKATGTFYKAKSSKSEASTSDSTIYYRISSNAFDYDRNEAELDSMEFTASDQTAQSFLEDKAMLNCNVANPNGLEYYMLMPFYDCGPIHVNTFNSVQSNNKYDADSTPLAFAYYGGMGEFAFTENNVTTNYRYHYATNQYYDNRGAGQAGGVVEAGLHYAGEHGLFVKYWTDFDAMLRYGFHLHECKAVIPFNTFRNIKMENPVILNGQACLIESITQNNDAYELKLRSILPKQSSNYDLENQQTQRLRENDDEQKYSWKLDTRGTFESEELSCKTDYYTNHSDYHNDESITHPDSGFEKDIRIENRTNSYPKINDYLIFSPPLKKDDKIWHVYYGTLDFSIDVRSNRPNDFGEIIANVCQHTYNFPYLAGVTSTDINDRKE